MQDRTKKKTNEKGKKVLLSLQQFQFSNFQEETHPTTLSLKNSEYFLTKPWDLI